MALQSAQTHPMKNFPFVVSRDATCDDSDVIFFHPMMLPFRFVNGFWSSKAYTTYHCSLPNPSVIIVAMCINP